MLEYLDTKLTKGQRKKVARYMAQYKNMEAIIRSKQLQLIPSKTSTLKENPVQESNISPSEAYMYLEKSEEVESMLATKQRLDIAYESIKPLHKLIWDEHFINDIRDFEIYYNPDHGINKKTYYREKNELMNVVAECLQIGTK